MSKFFLRLCLVLLSVGAALLVGELGLRRLMPQIGWRPFSDKILGWAHREFVEFQPTPRPDLPAAERPTRVLTLGDSFLAGSKLKKLDHRFPHVLEKSTKGRVDSQVFATGGWGTDQQLFAFRQKGADWEPDLVIIAFCANNDLANIISHSHGEDTFKPYFVLGDDGALNLFDTYGTPLEQAAGGVRVGAPTQSFLLDYLKVRFFDVAANRGIAPDDEGLFDAVDPRYRLWAGRDAELPFSMFEFAPMLEWSPQTSINSVTAYIKEDFELNTYAWRVLEAILGAFKHDVEEAGGELIMMLLPVTFRPQDARFIAGADFEHVYDTPDGEFTFRSAEPRDRLDAICKRVGIRFYDPTVAFIPHILEKDLMLECWPDPTNRHFAERAHFILGQLLALYLEREGLIRKGN